MGFDYGTEEEVKGGGTFTNPEVGQHSARVRSIIHCGLFRERFNNKGKVEIKKPAPQVVVIFELKDVRDEGDEEGFHDFEEDGETPLEIHKTFPLKKGDKATLTKFMKAIDPKQEYEGFDDFIGQCCMIDIKPGKEKGDDGKPKYVNAGDVTAMAHKLKKLTPELLIEGAGHVPFPQLTKEAIMEMNPITEVADILMLGEKYKGSPAEAIIAEIREENADYAKRKPKEEGDKGGDKAGDDGEKRKEEKTSDLDENEEF